MSRNGSKFADVTASARALRLFTVSADVEGNDAAGTAEIAASQELKNPRWLAAREREARAEALRDKIHRLLDDIEAEEAKDRPAMKRAWLRAKKLELRRLSFKPAEGLLAEEATFRKTRRKLRDAKSGLEDAEEGDGAVSSEDGKEFSVDNDNGAAADGDGVFNLSPTGRLARPNPRAAAAADIENGSDKRSKKALRNVAKIARFPLESGYKLGRLIRKRRQKAESAGSRDDGSSDGDDVGGEDALDEEEWGRRVVATPESRDRDQQQRQQRQQQRGRRSLSVSSDDEQLGNQRVGPVVRVVVVNDSDNENCDNRGGGSADCISGGGGGSRRGSAAAADIPELVQQQPSVGKKLRERLAIRKSRSRGSDSGSEASGGKEDKKRTEDERKKRDKKDKERKKEEKRRNSAKEKDGKKKQNVVSKTSGDLAENARRNSRASSVVSGPVDLVELEDADID